MFKNPTDYAHAVIDNVNMDEPDFNVIRRLAKVELFKLARAWKDVPASFFADVTDAIDTIINEAIKEAA